MTDNQERILRHSLGLTRRGTPYRNHFCSSPGTADWDDLTELENTGMMARIPSPIPMGDVVTFIVTDKGKEELAA